MKSADSTRGGLSPRQTDLRAKDEHGRAGGVATLTNCFSLKGLGIQSGY